ncbi:MAG: hypothetical protein CVU86_08675 [Firmicutes bacterium HGW-Firmicutes-11]|jgi:hypothetical protein|nr:MAG: hypothetical protein CVU86_08675 [Firmicutes bacterium HGW-Firmicutes-11]
MKQILALLLVMALMFSMVPAVAAATDQPSDWAAQELNEARSKGLVISAADQNYRGNINRELFCELVVNMVEKVNGYAIRSEMGNPFADTSNLGVLKAYSAGIVAGKTTTSFAPNDPITREQIAAMMMRAARYLDEENSMTYTEVSPSLLEQLVFADQTQISSYALSDIRLANHLGIMLGVGGNRIDPKGNTTVEQSILLIHRLFDGFKALPGAPIPPVNNAPVAKGNPVIFEVTEQTPLLIDAAQLASDLDGDELEVIAVNGQTAPYTTLYGTATLTAEGKISYTSNDIPADVTDAFAATVSDGTSMTHINVRIHVDHTLVLLINKSINSVSLKGTPAIGETVSLNLISYLGGAPSPAPTLSYQWMSSDTANGTYTNITGAVESDYLLTQGYVGKYLKLKVTASGSAGGTATSPMIGPVTHYSGGAGISSDPYVITNVTQFMLFNSLASSGKFYRLASDLELEQDAYITKTFGGNLNGDGHKIVIDANIPDDKTSAGLFASIGTGAFVGKLTVEGTINSYIEAVGGIAGVNAGTISGSNSKVTLTSKGYAGGIVGKNSGTIEKSYSTTGIVTGRYMLGGIAGINYSSGIVSNSYSRMDIQLEANAAGGLVGWNKGQISYCYSTGMIYEGLTNKGGLVGYDDDGTVQYSFYDKETSGMNDTGKGIPKTTMEMKNAATYTGWNFTSVWNIAASSYPWLR